MPEEKDPFKEADEIKPNDSGYGDKRSSYDHGADKKKILLQDD